MKEKIPHIFFHSKNLQVVLKEGNSSNSRPERFALDVSSACIWICLKQRWVGNTISTFTTSISFEKGEIRWQIHPSEANGVRSANQRQTDLKGGRIRYSRAQGGRISKVTWLLRELSDFQGVLNGNNLHPTAIPSRQNPNMDRILV